MNPVTLDLVKHARCFRAVLLDHNGIFGHIHLLYLAAVQQGINRIAQYLALAAPYHRVFIEDH
ncbi:hypothetical protein D3C87_1856860 [compost metagenome]